MTHHCKRLHMVRQAGETESTEFVVAPGECESITLDRHGAVIECDDCVFEVRSIDLGMAWFDHNAN